MNKIVYVTGCLGFIGAYVTEACLEQGWKVIGVDKVTYAARTENIDKFIKKYGKDSFKFIESDINDLDFLYECDYVINTAPRHMLIIQLFLATSLCIQILTV